MTKPKQGLKRTQTTREGYAIPVPTREAVFRDLKKIAKSGLKSPDKVGRQPDH